MNKADIVASPRWLNDYSLIVSSLIAMQAGTLFYFGQPIISRTGGIQLWNGDIHGRENSQHLTDWYTFTHVIHGIMYYWLLGRGLPTPLMPLRFLISVILEILWEILENTPMVINRYRRTALANGYSGDSILNSISDTVAMTFGYYLSKSLPSPATIMLALTSELISAYLIRDNFALNLIQLIYPLESISRWQSNQNSSKNNNVKRKDTNVAGSKGMYTYYVSKKMFRPPLPMYAKMYEKTPIHASMRT